VPTKIEAIEVLQIGPELTDVAVAVFVSHDATARAMEVNDISDGARDSTCESYMEDYREDVYNGTEHKSIRLLHTEVEPNRWMTTTVYGPSKETCVGILRRLFPKDTDAEGLRSLRSAGMI